MSEPHIECSQGENGLVEREIKCIKCGIDNCYIVRQGDNAIMVDTSSGRFRQRVIDAARKYDVQLVLLTHGHYDHVSNAVAVAEDLDVPIAMHAGDVDLVKDNHLQRMHASSLFGYLELFCVHKIRRRVVPESFVPDIFVTEGYSLSEFGIDAYVVELPGHTLGSIGLDVWGTDFLAGDAVISRPTPGPASLYSNRAVMEASCNKLFRLGKRTVHCGHGNPIPNMDWMGVAHFEDTAWRDVVTG